MRRAGSWLGGVIALGTGTRRQTLVFAGASMQTAVLDSDAGFTMYQGTFSTSGATYNVNLACPFTGAAPATNNTATATTLTQFANANEYLVFTRM